MNLRVVALALVASLSFAAQAETVLYGKFHGSIDWVDNNNSLSSINVSSNSSRFGIKGKEDLGNGLKAEFQVENSISFSSQDSSTLAGRNTFVGLITRFGTFRLARHDTPFKVIGRKVDLFGDTIGDSRNITRQTAGAVPDRWDERASDVFGYVSPSFNNFQVFAAYIPDEVDAGGGDAVSINATYNPGNLFLGFAYETHGERGADDERPQGFRLVGSYKFANNFKITGLYQNLSFDSDTDQAYGLGLAYTLGKNTFKGQVYGTDNEGDNNNAVMYALGWDRKFSKRTSTYIIFAAADNDELSTYDLDTGGHGGLGVGAVGDETYYGLSFGVIHKF